MVQTSVAITKDNIFTQSHANVFNLINNRSNIPDPADESGLRKFVYTREPNFKASNFEGFPLIVVQDKAHEQSEKIADNSKAMWLDQTTILVFAQDKTSDHYGDPSGFEQLNTISNYIVSTLNNRTNSFALRANGLRNKTFPSMDFEWGEFDGKKIFTREFMLNFRQWRQIT